jgi:hypothetical protein
MTPPPETRNLVPAWTEDPTVTLISDDPNTTLELLDMSLTAYATWLTSHDPEEPYTPLSPTTQVCRAPCNMKLPARRAYQISGPKITPSRPFVLAPGENVTVRVRAGSMPWRVAGVAALFVAPLGILAGGLVSKNQDTRMPGYILIGFSGAILAGALPAIVLSSTRVEVDRDTPARGRAR